ncbi:MAG: hypothetical protein AAF846_21980 [Chloroflexota bacterium]
MDVTYEHPPRGARYYANFLIACILIALPAFIIAPIWLSHLKPFWISMVIIAVVVLRLPPILQKLLSIMTIVHDVGIPKDTDVSHLDLSPPDTLLDDILELELMGFERYGEYEGTAAGLDTPIPVWVMTKHSGRIRVELTEINDTPFVAFITYGTEGLVQTYYRTGHSLMLTNARFSGVRNSLEASYYHHRQQIKALGANIGKIVPVQNMKQETALYVKYQEEFRKFLQQQLIDFVATQMLFTAVMTPFFAWLGAMYLSPYIYGIFAGWRGIGTISLALVSGLLIVLISRRKMGKNIKRKQKN